MSNFFKEGFLLDYIWKKHFSSLFLNFLVRGVLFYSFFFDPTKFFSLVYVYRINNVLDNIKGNLLALYGSTFLFFLLILFLTILLIL